MGVLLSFLFILGCSEVFSRDHDEQQHHQREEFRQRQAHKKHRQQTHKEQRALNRALQKQEKHLIKQKTYDRKPKKQHCQNLKIKNHR